MKAQALRERFNNLGTLSDDAPDADLQGWPPRTADEKRLGELYSIVGDLIIYLEDQEQRLRGVDEVISNNIMLR